MQRWLFRRELEELAGQPVFYLDECGVDHRRYREYGRAPRGERIYQAVAGKRRERTSIITASQHGKLAAPLVFQGSGTTEVVDVYFEKVLLPELPPGSVIVLDNARFHQSPTTQRLVEEAGCQLLFLPAYSRTSLGRLQDPPAQRPRHRRQPLRLYRQYVPMLLLIAIFFRCQQDLFDRQIFPAFRHGHDGKLLLAGLGN